MSDSKPEASKLDGVRCERTGRFVKGHAPLPGCGRKRRRTLFEVAQERAEAEGIDLETELWAICKTLLSAARAGDMVAARQVLDRLTANDPTEIKVTGDGLSDVARVARVEALLASAASRRNGEHRG